VVDSVIRQIKVLALIPQLPSSTTTAEVHGNIQEYGFKVTTKTIERDLHTLSRFFPITAIESSKPYRWSFSELKVDTILNLTLEMALTLDLIKEYSQGLFPRNILNFLSPFFDQADKELSALSNNSLSNWRNKIHNIPSSLVLKKTKQDSDIVDKLYVSVMQEKKIIVNYRARGKNARDYTLEPVGIVLRGSLTYLLGTCTEGGDILQFLINRFNSVQVLGDSISESSRKLNVKDYIDQGALEILKNPKKIEFVARVRKIRGWHLYETPLSEDQEIIDDNKDTFLVKATVANSQHLLWWVLSLGSRIDVIEPESLRNEVISQMNEMVSQYR
jgi:predicted DNA-binding transcriptional regulator YafY